MKPSRVHNKDRNPTKTQQIEREEKKERNMYRRNQRCTKFIGVLVLADVVCGVVCAVHRIALREHAHVHISPNYSAQNYLDFIPQKCSAVRS